MQLPRPRVTREGSLSARAHGTVARTSLPHIDFEREPGAASRPLPRGYQRRTPETTALYAVIRDNLETFLDDSRQRSVTGLGYPEFIEKEFRRYLDCGILSRGFARVRCESCGGDGLASVTVGLGP